MTNDLINKIESLVGNISSPSPYTFLYESFENVNAVLDGLTFTKLAVLVNITKGDLNINGNNLTLSPPLTLVFAKSSDLQLYHNETTTKAIYDDLMDDVIKFVKLFAASKDVEYTIDYSFEVWENFLDYNLAAIALTFKTKLLNGININC